MCEYLDNVCAIHVQQWKLDHTFWTEYCQARNLGRPVRIRTKYFSEYNWQTMTHAYSISVFGSTVSLVFAFFLAYELTVHLWVSLYMIFMGLD